jgi:hypothetical protein
MQNFAVGEFSEPQERHRRVNGDAHSSQNFARSGFSDPHFEQRMAAVPLEALPALRMLHNAWVSKSGKQLAQKQTLHIEI